MYFQFDNTRYGTIEIKTKLPDHPGAADLYYREEDRGLIGYIHGFTSKVKNARVWSFRDGDRKMRFILTKESATLELFEDENPGMFEDSWMYHPDEQSWSCLGVLFAKTVYVPMHELDDENVVEPIEPLSYFDGSHT
jgi:hypothetical protein